MIGKFRFEFFMCVFALVTVGCQGPTRSSVANRKSLPSPADPWTISTIDFASETPALLWNGSIGFRLNRYASAASLPLYSIDEYEITGEEKIRSLVNPLPNGFIVDGKPLPLTEDYTQSLNMKTSELSTHWRSGSITFDCVTILHPLIRKVAQRWTLKGVTGDQQIDFDLGLAGKLGKSRLVMKEFRVPNSGIRARLLARKIQGQDFTVEVTLDLSQSPNRISMRDARFPGSVTTLPSKTGFPPQIQSFQQVEADTRKIWEERWQTDIEIDGPIEDQQAIRSFLYYLRSAFHTGDGMAVSPFGLSNQMYNGHVFWDADIWVFPSLALLDPDAAKAISDYRLSTYPIALKNSTGIGSKFAWESSVTGRETVSGPSKDEIHISGDVAFSLNQASSLGLIQESDSKKVIAHVSNFYRITAKQDPNSKELGLLNVMSPDENHVGNNDLYTNLIAQWTLNGGTWVSPMPCPHFKLPRDQKSLLTYDGDVVKSYKQAAAVLSIYPLQYPEAESQGKTLMDRFASKVSKNGPAMSDSVHSIIWSRLGDADKGYQSWRDSWQPFTKQPLLLFSEKRSKATTYFTTGAGGSLQAVLFGFLGFRLDSRQEQGANWTHKLLGNQWLSIKPNLPKNWKSVKLKNFSVLGQKFTLTAKHKLSGPDSAEVIQGD